jgi:hypothetical protein
MSELERNNEGSSILIGIERSDRPKTIMMDYLGWCQIRLTVRTQNAESIISPPQGGDRSAPEWLAAHSPRSGSLPAHRLADSQRQLF